MIRFDHVTKNYKGTPRPALDDVTTEILRGEFVFVVGASGSGKSTFLRLILREERPTRGKLHVLGQNLSSISNRKVPYFRRNVGVVFQDFRLLANKTVFDNVAFTLQVIGKSKGFIHEAVPDVLAMVGLDGKAQRYPHELSGGEQQRVAIARAVVNKPQILLADEPTGNLDPATSAGITAVLERINAAGTTVLMATHEAGLVDRMQKRVIQLQDGKLIRDERHGGYGFTAGIPVLSDSDAIAGVVDPARAQDPDVLPVPSAAAVGMPTPVRVGRPTRAERRAEHRAAKDASRGHSPAAASPATSAPDGPALRVAAPLAAAFAAPSEAATTSSPEALTRTDPLSTGRAQTGRAQNGPVPTVPVPAGTVPTGTVPTGTVPAPIASDPAAMPARAARAPASGVASEEGAHVPASSSPAGARSADGPAHREGDGRPAPARGVHEPIGAAAPREASGASSVIDGHFANPPTAPIRRPDSSDVAELSLAERLGLRAPGRHDHEDDSNQDVGPVS